MRKFAIGISSVLCLGVVLASGHSFRQHKEALAPFSSRPAAATAKTSKQESTARVLAQYGKTPLAFEANFGQANSEAKFLSRGQGYEIFLTPKESVFVLQSAASQSGASKDAKFASTTKASVLRMDLVGGNSDSALSAEEQLPGKTNYLLGNQPANWHTDVPTYRKVREHAAYPGIDLVYYGTQGQLEYDFVIGAHRDPSVIRLAMKGAEQLRTDADGNLLVSVGGGEVRFHKPYAYQLNGTTKETVASNYVLQGDKTVAFKIGNYDASRELIVDPILSYSTYLGGTNIDGANAIAVAPDNTAFITGGTFSTDFPTAGTHPLQPNHGGPDDFSKDAFVAKFSADGSTVLYATYLGGKEQDEAHGIAVDNAGNAYVTGTTFSPDFPITPAVVFPNCGGDGKCGASFNPGGLVVSNGFVSKLNPSGSALIYSEYIGYYEYVQCFGIAVDNDQNAYVTGSVTANIAPTVMITPPNTPPPPFPIVKGFQAAFGGGATDAFLMKFSASGLSIAYSTYLGGGDEDDAYGVAVDGSHNAYVTGLTYSADLPLANPVQAANGGAGDAFLAKVNTGVAGAGSLVFSSYLGGTGLDQGNGIAVDGAGNTYVTGATNSAGLATAAVLQGTNAGLGDAFVAKYSTSSATPGVMYFTYLGGAKSDSGSGIAVDALGNAYVAGNTVSTDFATTTDAFQRTYGGGNADAFVAKLDPLGATLLYSSYLGGTNTESGNGIAIDRNDPPGAYVAGQTCSQDFPLSNPAQSSSGGNCDAFVSKIGVLEGIAINPTGLVFAPQTLATTSAAQSVTITSGVSPVSITSIAIAGADSGDFAIASNTCGTSLAANSQCTVSVNFTPSADGNRTGTLSIVDSVAGQPPQSIVAGLSGSTSTVPDFSVTTTSPSASVSAGQAATFTLQVSAVNGYTQPVNLSCQGLPAGATCAFSANPVTPGATSVPVTVTINTAVRNMLPPSFRIENYPYVGNYPVWLTCLIAFLLFMVVVRDKQMLPRPGLIGVGVLALLLVGAVGCGGGNSTGTPAGTQAGTYTVMVVATSGSLSHSTTLTLQVK